MESNLYQVLSLHNPQLSSDQSCIYVGVTHRFDIEQCVQAVMREKFSELAAKLKTEGQQINVKLIGTRREKKVALNLKQDQIKKFKKAGCDIHQGRNSSAQMFDITQVSDEDIEA